MLASVTPPLDDQGLRDLAAEPAQPLFSALRHAEAMAPLVIVLAFLPALYAIAHRTVTEEGARQGLMSLHCLAARNLNEFIDPVLTGALTPQAYQPLLMSWLTALSLRVFGVEHVAGHVASAYLCTAGLIVSVYVFARRLGGDRLGLLTTLLIAFNPHVMKLAQEPAPPSASALFAVLALAGAVAHWQKASTPASIQLLLGGISLGLCMLAGGSVALAVVLALLIYAAWWKFDGLRRLAPDGTFDRSQSARSLALHSVFILVLTGFAVGGWRALLMGSRYGAEFWRVWLGIRAERSIGLDESVAVAPFPSVVPYWNYLVLPLAILAILGVGVVLRDLALRTEEPGRRHRGLLIAWLLVVAALWARHGFAGPTAPYAADDWIVLFVVPLSISAAIGLLAVIDRQLPFSGVVAVALATALDVAWIACRGNAWRGLFRLAPGNSDRWALLALLAVTGAAVLVAVFGTSLSTEGRRRRILIGIILGVVAANCVWGAAAVRRANPADRELDDLRADLRRVPNVTRWTLVVPNRKETAAPQPPAQLVYVLRSLWPRAPMSRVDSWDALATELASAAPGPAGGQHLIVVWSPQGRIRPTVPAGLLKSAAPPSIYREHEVAGFLPGDPQP